MKGQAQAIVVWLFILVMLFVMILGYTAMSKVMTSGIVEDIENISDISDSSDATGIISGTKTVWQYFLYVFLLAILLWGIFASGRTI